MFIIPNKISMINQLRQKDTMFAKKISAKSIVNLAVRVAAIVFLLAVALFSQVKGAAFAQDVAPQADLSVTKSDNIDPIIQRGDLTYTIVVTNNGPNAAENVTVSDTLPAGTTFNYASQTKGTCAISYPSYNCQIGTLQAGDSETMIVHIRPDVPGVITNNVSVASSTSDPDTSNNSDSENTTVTPLQADLSVTKSDDIDPIIQRGNLTYTIVVTNNGPNAAENVTVSDTLPAGTTFNYASQTKGTCAISYPSYNCQIGTLQVGESATMTVHIRPDAPGVIINTVGVASSTSDPDTSNNSDSENTTITPLQADLSVTKSDDIDPIIAGGNLTYTIVVTNNGPNAAENVTVSDTLPAGTTFNYASQTKGTCAISYPLYHCQVGTLQVGESATMTVHTRPDAPGVITNNVSVASSTSDPDMNNNSDGEDTTVYVLQADLSVTKSDDVDPVTDGEPLTYTVVVTNNGLDAAENVTLSDTLPVGTAFNFATITQGTCAIGFPLLQCQLGTLDVGDNVTLTVRVTPSSPGVITNTVSVTSDTDDPATSNNSDSEDTTVNARQADLSVTKSDDVDPVTEGEPLTYTIIVTNNGPHEAENVTLNDTLPTGASFKFATITQGTCAIDFPLLLCQIGTINAGGTVTLTIRVEPSSPGVITNTVSVASDTNDPNTSNNSDSEVTTVNGIPTVTVANGQCSATNLASGTINLALFDIDEDPLSLTLASNTNTGLIPNGNIVLGGSGNNRTISVTPKAKKSGTAILTFNLSDGIVTIPFTITVKIGTDKDEILNGTAGADMIFGLNGKNTINGLGGNDLLCGGNGVDTISGGDGNDIMEGQNGNDILNGGNDNDILRGNLGDDMLTGSAGADFFSGGAGMDTATDFNAGEGDTQDGTVP